MPILSFLKRLNRRIRFILIGFWIAVLVFCSGGFCPAFIFAPLQIQKNPIDPNQSAVTSPHWRPAGCRQCHNSDQPDLNPILPEKIDPICLSCHNSVQAPAEVHPVGRIPPLSDNMNISADWPLIDGKLGCLTCHDIYQACDRAKTRPLINPMFLRDRWDRNQQQFCQNCHRAAPGKQFIPHIMITGSDDIIHLDQEYQIDESRCLFCHLEVRFAHDQIELMLEGSSHSVEVLNQANQLLDDSLAADQSQCLLCHNEPTYRRSEMTWAQQEAPINRCNVCHDQSLVVDTQGYYWHVHARSIPARSNREQVRYCAVCHSNEKILNEFELPNSTASYLASFHGKGMQLNDETTAGCLDCHVNSMENVHQIKSYLAPDSAVGAERVADTCRSPQCHPKAGAKMGSAAVHLDLKTSKGAEYFIAVIFVLLIISTFGPSVMLTVLHMFQIVIGRYDQDDQVNHHRAEKLIKTAQGRRLLKRFTPFQRVQHWFLVITFATLVLTGYPMKFADSAVSEWFIGLIGGLSVARVIHRIAGILLLVGFFYHLCVYVTMHIRKEKIRTGHSYFHIFYHLPMCMNLPDFKRMGQYLLYLFCLRKRRPRWGRFNLEEKFEYFGVAWGTVLLGVTGLLMWDDALTTRFLPGRTLTISNLIHSFESYLALLHVGIVHLANVLIAPASFPCSPAMFTGDTPAEEIAEAHPLMIDDAEKKLGLGENGPESPKEANHV